MERRLSAILAADVVGYSRLMELDEAGTFERLRAHRKDLFEPEIERHHGRIFKLMGDGILAEFGSVVDAVECAVSLQRGMAERNAAIEAEQRIDVRIGINLGEVIVDGDDRYGEGVNVAARLQQLAEPGGIFVSGKVSKEVERKLAFGFESIGEQHIKNIDEPIHVYRVKLDGIPRRAARRRTAAFPWLRAASAALVAALVAVGAWFALPGLTGSSSRVGSSAVPSIAVLPFDNMSGDPEMSYFSDGVSEDIISMLARSPDVSVVARNSSFTYKGKPVDVRQVGTDLGVDYVLEGSVRKGGDDVRIVAQLVNAENGEHVWAERFDKSSPDPWALQDEVTGRIIAALAGERGHLKQAQYRKAWGADRARLEEYDYYLRGHDLFMRFQPDPFEQAGDIWKEGLSKFPGSALLQVKLGFYHFMRVYNGWSDDPAADFKRADELVEQAFAHANLTPLERRLAHWLAAYVSSQKRESEEAIRHAEAAVALAPYDAFLIGDLSQILIMAGRPEQGIEWAKTAASNDPANLPIYKQLEGWALTVLEKPKEALDPLRQATMSFISTPLLRAINLVRLDRMEDAKAELEIALKMDPTFSQAKWRDMFFYSDPAIEDREIRDLAKAGLPEV